MTDEQIAGEGMRALIERLGIDGACRFLTVANANIGNYTEERQAFIEKLTVGEIFRRARQHVDPAAIPDEPSSLEPVQ